MCICMYVGVCVCMGVFFIGCVYGICERVYVDMYMGVCVGVCVGVCFECKCYEHVCMIY